MTPAPPQRGGRSDCRHAGQKFVTVLSQAPTQIGLRGRTSPGPLTGGAGPPSGQTTASAREDRTKTGLFPPWVIPSSSSHEPSLHGHGHPGHHGHHGHGHTLKKRVLFYNTMIISDASVSLDRIETVIRSWSISAFSSAASRSSFCFLMNSVP